MRMKKFIFLFLAALAFCGNRLFCQAEPSDSAEVAIEEEEGPQIPDTAKIGAFVTSIFDFSLADNSFSADFWLWLNYSFDSTANLLESTEISNAKHYEYFLPDVEIVNGITWGTQKCRATIKKDWNIANFPFDNQVLIIEMEESILDATELVYVADTVNTIYDHRIHIDGWTITDFGIRTGIKDYRTSYGDPEISGSSHYAGAEVFFKFQRDGISLFFKLFTGIYVAFGISLLVFFMGPENAERFGLLVGSLFAGIGNKYVVDSLLPETTTYTLVDKVHTLTFLTILVSLITTVIAYRLNHVEKRKAAWRVDKTGFIIVIVAYFSLNIYFFLQVI